MVTTELAKTFMGLAAVDGEEATRGCARGGGLDILPAARVAGAGAASPAAILDCMPSSAATLPGGLPAQGFLRRHWQRRPLLVRNAIPGFTGMVDRAQVFALARRDDVESRLVLRHGHRYALEHGPFTAARLRVLPARNWTLLVQGLNLVEPAADALLRRFAFLPYARLDDVMVSYAAPGGGVGPHFDSYDVFLLQGFGRRRWRYGAQRDLALVPGLPVKILQRFEPTDETVLGPGDLLYLPPHMAHDGVALDACTTYSIGFRAPAHQELAEAFLDHLRDALDFPGRYADPGVAPTRHPARIDRALAARMGAPLSRIRWTARDVEAFLGRWLSEPKPHVAFTPPARPLAPRAFAARAAREGVRLDPAAVLLYDARRFYLNGDEVDVTRAARTPLAHLADARRLSPAEAARADALHDLLHEWHAHGFLHLGYR
jgi:50S ribosomal protein L16 3-hydroxylase